MTKKQQSSESSIAQNKKARFDYFIEDRLEAGLALQGWEVKSMRAGKAQITDSYVILREGEAWLLGSHVTPLNTVSTHFIAEPKRIRKLLLNRREIDRLTGLVERKGYTLSRSSSTGARTTSKSPSASRRARSSTTSATPRRTATGSATRRAR